LPYGSKGSERVKAYYHQLKMAWGETGYLMIYKTVKIC